MHSEFSPAGIIGLGLSTTSSIILELRLWDTPDNYVDVLTRLQVQVDQNAR